eukprot:1731212-Amphidinium_carterae.1
MTILHQHIGGPKPNRVWQALRSERSNPEGEEAKVRFPPAATRHLSLNMIHGGAVSPQATLGTGSLRPARDGI